MAALCDDNTLQQEHVVKLTPSSHGQEEKEN